MAILAYDEVMLREPRLLLPGEPPIGRVKASPLGLSLQLVEGAWANGTQIPGSLGCRSWSVISGSFPTPYRDPTTGILTNSHTADGIVAVAPALAGFMASPYTIMWRAMRITGSNSDCWQIGRTTSPGYWVSMTNFSTAVNITYDDNATNRVISSPALVVEASVMYDGAFQNSAGIEASLYHKPARTALEAAVATGTANAAVGPIEGLLYLGLGSYTGATSYHADFYLAWLFFFQRLLTPAEMYAIQLDPFSLVEPA